MTEASIPQAGQIHLKLFGRTHVGQVREHNEDNFLIADLTTKSRGLREEDRERVIAQCGNLFGVCDGMGGAAAGEIASQLAVDIVFEMLASAPPPTDRDDLARNLVHAVEEAGLRIFNEARADRSRRGLGTTSTIAALIDARLFLAQVGDSRGYILRGDQFVQVTRDQSLVNQLIEAGQLTEEEAETFEHNNIILQALGTSETVQVDLTYADLKQGDTLMLCSDGLSGMIRDSEMKEVLQRVSDPLEACRELTDRANAAGGHDNITVIIVKFFGPGVPPASPQDEPLTYRKYPLPSSNPLSSTSRVGPASSSQNTPPEAPAAVSERSPAISDEAANETRDLRVSHTMIGSMKPSGSPSLSTSGPPWATGPRLEDEPVELPTHGFPPQLVGAVVLFSLLLILVVGIFLLR